MNRREVLKAITGITAAAEIEMRPTYVTAQDVAGVDVLILKCAGSLSADTAAWLKTTWEQGIKGTVLEGVRVVVLSDNLSLEFIRRSS